MKKSIYEKIGGFMTVRKLITEFYEKVLDNEELAVLFEGANMEHLIDHQTKFFASILGGPASFTDIELEMVHKRLNISDSLFDLTKDCLVETIEDADLSEDIIEDISDAFESKRKIIVQI